MKPADRRRAHPARNAAPRPIASRRSAGQPPPPSPAQPSRIGTPL